MFFGTLKFMSQENRRKALSLRQPLNGKRVLIISVSRQSEDRKDILSLEA